MRIALVHELLTMRGGAEKVFTILANMFPEAPIYTLLYNEKKLGNIFPKERIRTSDLQPKGFWKHWNTSFNHHLYLSRMPKAIEAWDFSSFDLVISSSSAFAHNCITNGAPKHLSYVNSPARYLWDRTFDVQEQAAKSPLGFLKKYHLQKTFHALRTWDAEASARADMLLCASKDVQRRVALYWNRESAVLHPPIDSYWTEQDLLETTSTEPYYFIASTLVPYKRIDIAINACNALGVQLIIAGEGPQKSILQKRAGPTIKFVGHVDQNNLRQLYTNATAYIIPGIEDFGLAPLEALSCGTPVMSFRAGGPRETIIEGITGAFFEEPTAQSLQEALKHFDQKMYSKESCRNHACTFSEEAFRNGIQHAIETVMQR